MLEVAQRVYEGRHFRIPTGELNRLIRDAYQKHPPPARGMRRLKILYVSQVAVAPPVILLHVNDPKLAHFTYKRFLENQIRAGVSVRGHADPPELPLARRRAGRLGWAAASES